MEDRKEFTTQDEEPDRKISIVKTGIKKEYGLSPLLKENQERNSVKKSSQKKLALKRGTTLSPKKKKPNRRKTFRKLGSQESSFQPTIRLVKASNEVDEDLNKFNDSSALDSQFSPNKGDKTMKKSLFDFPSERSIELNFSRMAKMASMEPNKSDEDDPGEKYPTAMGIRFAKIFQQKVELSKLRERQRRDERKYKVTDTACAIAAFALLCVLAYENEQSEIEKVRTGIEIYWARIVIILLTIFIDICIIIRYRIKKRLSPEINQKKNIFQTKLIFYMLLELAVCSVCMPPNVHYSFSGKMLSGSYTYSYAQIINILGMCKTSYLIGRVYFHYNLWRKNRNSSIANSQNIRITTQFSLKAELKYNPITVVIICGITTVFYFSFAFRNLEIGFIPDDGRTFELNYIANALWLTIVTMTTVGYGDIYPQTHMGRFVAVLSFCFGNFLTSFITVILSTKADLTEQENKAYCMIKKLGKLDKVENCAANVIRNALLLRQQNKVYKHYTNLHKSIKKFSEEKKSAASHNLPIPTILLNMIHKHKKDFKQIKEAIEGCPRMVEKLRDVNSKVNETHNKMDKIKTYEKTLAKFFQDFNNQINERR
ncbi:unnamed protein product [Moneuplotes crassus]|uniref:Potassium channel domain-containing protein n=1 Tax=Euplotes crassus TaxID=5936 RepID=A0AAD1U206_EUPCR|nr:unnamed protein product [Moneuplotes crassus]